MPDNNNIFYLFWKWWEY